MIKYFISIFLLCNDSIIASNPNIEEDIKERFYTFGEVVKYIIDKKDPSTHNPPAFYMDYQKSINYIMDHLDEMLLKRESFSKLEKQGNNSPETIIKRKTLEPGEIMDFLNLYESSYSRDHKKFIEYAEYWLELSENAPDRENFSAYVKAVVHFLALYTLEDFKKKDKLDVLLLDTLKNRILQIPKPIH
ncbi:hypothetical protein IM40_03795 [Candidatus Paracaedimonas acanthamoebae]|nr:hypothetical protein IM40_03795 [Candidatus Paracaedimonas acanthamoebae]